MLILRYQREIWILSQTTRTNSLINSLSVPAGVDPLRFAPRRAMSATFSSCSLEDQEPNHNKIGLWAASLAWRDYCTYILYIHTVHNITIVPVDRPIDFQLQGMRCDAVATIPSAFVFRLLAESTCRSSSLLISRCYAYKYTPNRSDAKEKLREGKKNKVSFDWALTGLDSPTAKPSPSHLVSQS
jgi:hypothetical protein